MKLTQNIKKYEQKGKSNKSSKLKLDSGVTKYYG